MKFFLLVAIAGLVVAGCNQPAATTSGPGSGVTPASPTMEPDNTGKNVRDRSEAAKTPIDQNENQADVDTTANIRKQIVDTKMSVDAQNVKIMTQSGKVTLRGPVHSEEEKRTIEEIAVKVAGADRVDNQLEVKSN